MEPLTTDEILNRSALLSDFSIIRKLNSGGFGTVYEAQSKKDGSTVAIKVLDPKNDNMAEKFNEIIVCRQMKHPHIIYVSDIMMWESRSEFFIVMEKAQKSLHDLLAEKNKLEKGLIFQVLCDAISGLQYAAKINGISHSDLKPHNILINCEKLREKDTQNVFVSDKKTTFKLVDWGCAVIQGAKLNQTVTVMGQNSFTMAYSPPEIIQHRDHINLMKSDVYSLGLTILSCCGVECKTFKFINKLRDKNEHTIQVQNILDDKKYKLDEKYSEVVEILRKMISYDPTERPDYDEILDSVAKVHAKLCLFCKKSHVTTQILPDCQHKFGQFCLIEHFKLEFAKNSLYIPRCPLDSCKQTINQFDLKEILGRKLFQQKYIKCKQCQKIFRNTNSLTLDLCNHNFCFKCFTDIAPTRECPIVTCKADFSRQEKKNFEAQMKRCSNCSSESENLVRFDCCYGLLCIVCLSKSFSTLLNNQLPLFCLFCRETLKEAEIDSLRKCENQRTANLTNASSIEIKNEEQSKIMEKQNRELKKANEEKKVEESKITENKTSVRKKSSGVDRPSKKMSEQLKSDQDDEEKVNTEANEENRTLHISKVADWIKLGVEYAKKKNHVRALDSFLEASKLGDQIGMFKVANYYFNGNLYGLEKNLEKAFSYFQKSADKGYAPAMFSLAYMLKKKGKIDEAILYYQKASEKKHPGAASKLAEIYEKQNRYDLAMKYYKIGGKFENSKTAGKFSQPNEKKIWHPDFEVEPDLDKSAAEDLGFDENKQI